MSKKLISLALVLILLLTGVVYAIGPSKQTGDLTVAKPESSSGKPFSKNFQVSTDKESQFSNDTFDEIEDFMSDGTAKFIEYFPRETVREILNFLKDYGDVNEDELVIDDFMPLKISGYDTGYKDVTINFTFPTEYHEGQPVVAVIGVKNGNNTEWIALRATVNSDGSIDINFTEDIMKKISVRDTVLAILSAPVADSEADLAA